MRLRIGIKGAMETWIYERILNLYVYFRSRVLYMYSEHICVKFSTRHLTPSNTGEL